MLFWGHLKILYYKYSIKLALFISVSRNRVTPTPINPFEPGLQGNPLQVPYRFLIFLSTKLNIVDTLGINVILNPKGTLMEKKVRFTSDSTLSQQCYEQIQNEIIDGVLKPGEKLKVAILKDRFSVGQSPVREALSRLAAFGLVDSEDNKGFRVATISESDIRDTYAIFTNIENIALAQAIEHGDDTWEASIVAELHKLALIENRNTFDSYALWAERNYNFHVALISGCNSPTLLEIRRNLYMKFDRYCRMTYQFTKDQLMVNHEEHKKLAAAVLQRDTKAAQALMTHHINGPLEDVIKKFRDNKLI